MRVWSLVILILGTAILTPALAQEHSKPMGLPAGEKAPAFKARDQFGREQTLDSLRGPQGLVLLFFRSADW